MKDVIFIILISTALTGGLFSFWGSFAERLCRRMGCMKYTYDVVVWRHHEDELDRHQIVFPNVVDTKTERLIGLYLAKTYPEYLPFSIVSITLKKRNPSSSRPSALGYTGPAPAGLMMPCANGKKNADSLFD